MIQENPASKLYNLLRNTTRYQDNTNFQRMWSEIFEIDTNDVQGLLKNYNAMLDLYYSTKKLIETNELLNNQMNKKHLDKVGLAIMNFNMNNNVSSIKSYLNGETLTALFYISQHLSFVYQSVDSVVDEDQIKEIISEIDLLISSISESELPDDVKLLLFKNLSVIRESLLMYKITGVEGIKTSLEQSLGSLIMNNQTIIPERDNDNVEKTFKIISRLGELISIAKNTKELVAPIFDMLVHKH